MIAQFMYVRHQQDLKNIQLQIETARILDLYTNNESNYGPAFTLAGQFFSTIDETLKAVEMLEIANNLVPEDDIAWRLRLQLLLSEKRYDDAIEVGIEANVHVPEDAFIQYFVGTLLC